jgi:hypothetical protein
MLSMGMTCASLGSAIGIQPGQGCTRIFGPGGIECRDLGGRFYRFNPITRTTRTYTDSVSNYAEGCAGVFNEGLGRTEGSWVSEHSEVCITYSKTESDDSLVWDGRNPDEDGRH